MVTNRKNLIFSRVIRFCTCFCMLSLICLVRDLYAPDMPCSLENLMEHSTLRLLLNDFKNYKTKNVDFHAGDLYEHSVWTANTVVQWWQEDNEWVRGIDSQNMCLTIISALLHDVGKAGDLKFVYKCKRNHPRIGFEYLMGCRQYLVASNGAKKWNLNQRLSQLPLNDTEKKIVAILCGIHWDYGEIVLKGICQLKKNGVLTNAEKDKIYHKYLMALRKVCLDACYNDGTIDDQLLRMAILISASDVRGVRCNRYKNQIIIHIPAECHCAKINPYKQLNYEECGLNARRGLLNYFATKWKKHPGSIK